MAGLNLKDIISGELDPKRMEMQAKYENKRYAISRAYELAKDFCYMDSTKVTSADGEVIWVEAPLEEKLAAQAKAARLMTANIEFDLNAALDDLNKESSNGSGNTELPRAS